MRRCANPWSDSVPRWPCKPRRRAGAEFFLIARPQENTPSLLGLRDFAAAGAPALRVFPRIAPIEWRIRFFCPEPEEFSLKGRISWTGMTMCEGIARPGES